MGTQERMELMEAVKTHRIKCAVAKAEDMVEEKRDKAAETLEAWRSGVDRAERNLREKELRMTKDAETNWAGYMERLWKIGISKHNRLESQAQKNDELKTRIQSSLVAQLEERQRKESSMLNQALTAKQQAAAFRREKGMTGRYNFVEKAFGPQAVGFDAKHHWATTDRRSSSWQKSAEAWAQRGTASEPSLILTR